MCLCTTSIINRLEIRYQPSFPALLLPNRLDAVNQTFEHNLKKSSTDTFTIADAIIYFFDFVRRSVDAQNFCCALGGLKKLHEVLKLFPAEPFAELEELLLNVIDLKKFSELPCILF